MNLSTKQKWSYRCGKQTYVDQKVEKVKVKSLSHVQLYETPPSMEFSRQENWSGLPFPSPGDLPNPGIEPVSPARQVDSLPLSHWGSPKPHRRFSSLIGALERGHRLKRKLGDACPSAW